MPSGRRACGSLAPSSGILGNMCSPNWQRGHHLGAWEKFRVPGPTPDYGARISLSSPRTSPPIHRAGWDPIRPPGAVLISQHTPHSTGHHHGHTHVCLPTHRMASVVSVVHSTQDSASRVGSAQQTLTTQVVDRNLEISLQYNEKGLSSKMKNWGQREVPYKSAGDGQGGDNPQMLTSPTEPCRVLHQQFLRLHSQLT